MNQIEQKLIKFVIPTLNTLEIITAYDIVCIEANDRFCRVNLIDGSHLNCSEAFGKINYHLTDLPDFFQCHKSHMINLIHLKRYHKEGYAEMSNGQKVPVARRRKDTFLIKIKNYWMSFGEVEEE